MTKSNNKLMNDEVLYNWQKRCLFITVFLFPLQTILFYHKNLHDFLSFYQQIAAVPLLVGIGLATVDCIHKNRTRSLLPFLLFSSAYLLVIAVISIHSIISLSATGAFDASTFGETRKIAFLRSFLSDIGISNNTILYSFLIFMRDFLTGFKEIIYAFGFAFWVAILYRREPRAIFNTIEKAILCDVFLLAPYVSLEILHVYGVGGATDLLKRINSFLYESGGRVGWYPPIVSPNQVRGTWTEPSFFAVWLVFVTPFLIYRFSQYIDKRKLSFVCLFFLIYWCVWQMTYSRTSIILMIALFVLYLFVALISCKRDYWIKLIILSGTFAISFLFVSNFGPAEMTIGKSKTQDVVFSFSIDRSEFVKNTVESAFDTKSRSNPIRIENTIRELSIFKQNPLLGVGDTLCSVPQVKWMEQNYSSLTHENRVKLKFMQTHGIFESYAGNCFLMFTGVLMCRGILGFILMYFPIVCLGVLFFIKIIINRRSLDDAEIAVFISCVGVFLTGATPGLWFLYFWCVAGLALGIILDSSLVNTRMGVKKEKGVLLVSSGGWPRTRL